MIKFHLFRFAVVGYISVILSYIILSNCYYYEIGIKGFK